jgi:hypothetical protein
VVVIRDSGCGTELQQLRFGLGFGIYLEIFGWKFVQPTSRAGPGEDIDETQ